MSEAFTQLYGWPLLFVLLRAGFTFELMLDRPHVGREIFIPLLLFLASQSDSFSVWTELRKRCSVFLVKLHQFSIAPL